MSRATLISRIPDWAKVPVRVMRSAAERQDYAHEWRRRWRGEPALPAGPIRRVVVICHGNICRSPFAGLDLAARAPHVEVRTAGLEAGDGNPPEPFARSTAAALGVPLDGHGSRRFDAGDVEWADLIVAMQGRHIATLGERWPEAVARARLLGDYLPGPPHMLEDPWGHEESVFRSVFERIARADERLAALLAVRAEVALADPRSAPDEPSPASASGGHVVKRATTGASTGLNDETRTEGAAHGHG